MTKTQGYPGDTRPFFTKVMEPGAIDEALSRFPHKSGDRVLVTNESDVSKELGTSYRDVPATIDYVYYNGFVNVYFDEPRAFAFGGTYKTAVVRWSQVRGAP